MTDLTESAPSTTQSGTPDTHQPTLPPEVEKALQAIEDCYTDYQCEDGCCDDRLYNHLDEADLLRAHLTAQAEEIERLNRIMVAIAEEHPQPAEMLFRERKLNETLLDMTAERDRYKALIRDGIQAFAFTRDYVQPKVDLPAIEGWPWYEWCKAAEEATRE